MKKIERVVAENIRAYRKQRGLTIERLAEAAGIDAGHAGHILGGSRCPSLAVLARISTALQVSPADLLVDPGSASKENLDRRFRALLEGLGRTEKADLLALLGSRHRGRELKALRLLLRV